MTYGERGKRRYLLSLYRPLNTLKYAVDNIVHCTRYFNGFTVSQRSNSPGGPFYKFDLK